MSRFAVKWYLSDIHDYNGNTRNVVMDVVRDIIDEVYWRIWIQQGRPAEALGRQWLPSLCKRTGKSALISYAGFHCVRDPTHTMRSHLSFLELKLLLPVSSQKRNPASGREDAIGSSAG